MLKNKTYNRKKIWIIFLCCTLAIAGLTGRLCYIMIFRSDYYSKKAESLHERERDIKAARGQIVDRNGVVLADNKTVCTISVIHSQLQEPERVIEVLAKELSMSEEAVRKRVEKYSSIERVKTNVDKAVGDSIRSYNLAGVKVDEDYKRYYPFDSLASKVIGFTGGDNQGIIGLEVIYEEYLKGENGTILTMTDARGIELPGGGENRIEPINGNTLRVSLDSNIQQYAEQIAKKAMEAKSADSVGMIVMKPMTGEILAMVNVPEFNLNEPFTLNVPLDESGLSDEEKQNLRNQMWRNGCINDTYEPGSTFKVITAAVALENQVVALSDRFHCPGFKVVENRRIRCHKVSGHGAEDFIDGIKNSCNPVFVEVGMRIGVDRFYEGFEQLGLLQKTGIDLPGEAATIMHKKENIGPVELATVSFGQSFQITPIQLVTTISSIVNGGNRITPHFGLEIMNEEGKVIKDFQYEETKGIVSSETAETMKYLLEQVVESGGGKNAFIEGYTIGGKTATSQTLPRGSGKYISSFVGFSPTDEPEVLALVMINNPQGVYYGGTIAAPLIRELYENILPYLEIERAVVNETEETS